MRTIVDGVSYLAGVRNNGPSGPCVKQPLRDLNATARRGGVLSIAAVMVLPHGAQITVAVAWIDLPDHAMAPAGATSKLARNSTTARPRSCARGATGLRIPTGQSPAPG